MAPEDLPRGWRVPLSDPARVRAATRLMAAVTGPGSLDRVTALAARLCGAAHSHVAVLSDTLDVVSRHGEPIGEDGHGRLQGTLCYLTVTAADPVVIPDTGRDPRAAEFAMVREGRARAYLGAPLVSRDGTVIGALCLVDRRPRPWSDEQVRAACEMAAAVATALELAGVSGALTRLAEQYEMVLAASDIGAFDWDVRSGHVAWDERLQAMFGYKPGEFEPVWDSHRSRIHPDDVDRVSSLIDDAIQSAGEYCCEHRILLPDGSVRWVRARGRCLAGVDGEPERFVGAVHDVTGVRGVEAQLARMLEDTPTPFLSMGADFTLSYVNPAAEKTLGVPASDLVGKDVWKAFPSALGTRFEDEYRRVLRDRVETTFEEYEPTLDAWFECRAWPTADGVSVYFNDVTARRRAEEERRVALAERERAMAASERAASRLRLLADTGAAMSATNDESSVVDVLLDALVPQLGSWAAVELFPDAGSASTPALHRSLGQQPGPDAPTTFGTVRTRGGRTLGTVRLVWQPDADPDAEQRILDSLAERAGVAVDNTRFYAAQRSMSEALQRSMLTELPECPGLELAARYRPAADHAHVGGDWYDAFARDDGSLMLVVGDVVGHDRHAAASMGQLRNLMRGVCLDRQDPAGVLCGLDRAMDTMGVHAMASALVARVEPPDRDGNPRRFSWSSAGHLPPLLVHADGTAGLLSGEGDLLLGVDSTSERAQSSTVVGPGETVVLYTDGLVESRSRSLDERLGQLVDTASHAGDTRLHAQSLVDTVLADMAPHRPGDDMAVIAMRLDAGAQP